MRRSVWVAKDSPRITAGELQKLVESWGQKPKKKKIKRPLHHHMLFGRVSRKILLTHPKTNSSMFRYQTRLELQMALASMVRWNWKKKKSFLAANPLDEFSTNRDNMYPMSTVKYTAGSLMLWACFSARGPEHLVQFYFNDRLEFCELFWMKDQKDKQCRFIFTAAFAHIYQGFRY